MTSLDVGQGDSHLLVTPQGRTLLLDAGGTPGEPAAAFDVGEDVVSPYLWSRGIARLDVVALSHAHADHVGGLGSVMANFRPRELWIGALHSEGPLPDLVEAAAQQGFSVRRLEAGDAFSFGGVEVEVLAPFRAEATPRAVNNDSVVLRLRYGNTAVLMAGDAERKVELALAEAGPHADLLKVAHHGSATSTQPELLRAVQPRFAVISAGFANPYHYPAPAVLRRLQEAHAATFRTDMNGAATFYLDGREVRPQVRR